MTPIHVSSNCPACSEIGSALNPAGVFDQIGAVHGASSYDHVARFSVYMSWLKSGALYALHEEMNKLQSGGSAEREVRKMARERIDSWLGLTDSEPTQKDDDPGEWGNFTVVPDEDAEELEYEDDPFGEGDQGW